MSHYVCRGLEYLKSFKASENIQNFQNISIAELAYKFTKLSHLTYLQSWNVNPQNNFFSSFVKVLV